MNLLDPYFIMIISVLGIGGVFGTIIKINLDRHRKSRKILSKRQKRELENKKHK